MDRGHNRFRCVRLLPCVVVAAAAALGAAPSAFAVDLVTAPVDGSVPNSDPDARLHLAYNGHPTTLKDRARLHERRAGAGLELPWVRPLAGVEV